ncbi:MAG: CopD family protein [Bacteroidia bacterium]
MVYVKSLHIIFLVSWFAALFYFPRLLIYHREAQDKQEPEKSILSEQFKIMQRRLWYAISWPAMILTWVFGLWTSWFFPAYYTQAWFILKLVFVLLLSLYHIRTHFLFKEHQNNNTPWSSFKLRLWNEVATILLFAITFLVVPKQNTGWVWATLGLILFTAGIFIAVAVYKRNRDQEQQNTLPEQNES